MGRATTLLVASGGGHLTQLRLLHDRLRPRPAHASWVSYRSTHARSSLAAAHYIPGHGPSTRHLGNAARNWRLARQVLAGGHVEQVVSTGAGIALPFLVEAGRLGIPSHYIESASRVHGPSLTGRLLQELGPSAHLYTQHDGWADHRWRYVGSVYDGWTPIARRQERRRGLRVLVSLGTHDRYHFPALVTSVRQVLMVHDQVVWQLGRTPGAADLPGRQYVQLPAAEMDALLRWADVVVAHAGTGVILSCLQAGRHPVVVPRRRARGEHVDDHQEITAREVAKRDLATWSEAQSLSRADLRRAAGRGCRRGIPRPFPLVDREHAGTYDDLVVRDTPALMTS